MQRRYFRGIPDQMALLPHYQCVIPATGRSELSEWLHTWHDVTSGLTDQ